MRIKDCFKRIVLREKANSDSYIKYLRSKGMKIGENTTIYVPSKTSIDTTRPWMIEIGDNVKITEGVTMLTHGYEWSVLKNYYGEVLGSAGKITVGNNVFIGMQTTILKGVTIGNNVIIGANCLVNRDIPSNCIVAGNPAKVVMTLDDYYKKRKESQLSEAKELVQSFRSVYGKNPSKKELAEFFWLFSDGDTQLTEDWKYMMERVGNIDNSYKNLRNNKKEFENFDEFINSVK